jgi:hypothetical protein
MVVNAIIAIISTALLGLAVWYFCLKPNRPAAPKFERLTSLEGILPVLRNVHGDDDTFKLAVVNSPVCEGIGIFAAKPSKMPAGNQFVQYIMKNDLKDLGNPTEASVMKMALDNLAKGLQASVVERDDDKMLSLTNQGTLGASAIAIPGLYANCVEWLGGEKFIAGAPNLDTLLVCRADSSFRANIEEAVDRADTSAHAIDFDPCLFEITTSGISLTVPAG